MENFQKILIIRLSAIGDVVNVLPALKVLRTSFPSAHITWLVEDRAKDVIYGNPDLNEIIVFPRKQWQKEICKPSTFLSVIFRAITFFKSLRKSEFDLIIDFQGNLKSGLMTMFSGKCIKLGFDSYASKEWNHLFTNRHAHLANERIHRIDKNLELLKSIRSIKSTNIDAGNVQPQIIVNQKDNDYISDFLDKNTDREKRLVVIHPGTSEFGEYKRWPVANYALLTDMLIERLNVSALLTWGGPSDLKIVEEITSLMKRDAIISCQTQSIKQLTEIIRQSYIFISGDTGPMHIASILRKPIIAIFGPKDPVIYGPYTHSKDVSSKGNKCESDNQNINTRIIRKDIPCSPCKKRTCNHNTCINNISPDEVFEVTSELLAKLENKKA
ncbi:MAG: glycosyltransferase family 9 protein [Candidatus Anammoxibacter sp.]